MRPLFFLVMILSPICANQASPVAIFVHRVSGIAPVLPLKCPEDAGILLVFDVI
jgi:hypothetical protein